MRHLPLRRLQLSHMQSSGLLVRWLLGLVRQLHLRRLHVPDLLPSRMTMGAEPRTTRQQVAIRHLLQDTEDFRSAQQLHALLQKGGDRIGLATVYRSLNRMADQGEVDVLVRPDGEALYRSCSSGHHHHLVCRSCGLTVEVAGPAVENWTRKVAADEGFTDVSHTLEIFGLCAACSRP